MKSWFKKVLLAVLAVLCVVSMAACGKKADKSGPKVDFDFSEYPEDFNDWTMDDLHKYFEAAGVFVEEDWYIELSSGDTEPMNATGGCLYLDMATMAVYDMVVYFDTTVSDAVADMRDKVATDKKIVVEGADPLSFDTMVGNFAIQYETTTDADHKDALLKALDDIKTYYEITEEF